MFIKKLRNIARDFIFESIGLTYHFYIYLKQDRAYIKDSSRGIYHEKALHQSNPQSENFCIFVLFQHGKIPNHVLVQLDWINKLGYSIHIVSNCPVSKESLDELKSRSFKVTQRPNIGYDFGAYQYGVQDFLDTYSTQANRLMLMNDSIFFPLLDPTESYKKVDSRQNDFWGWTENWEIHYHIASYGMVFKPSAFQSDAFKEFWSSYKPYSNRKHAINNGEVKLSEILVDANLQPDTAIRSFEIRERIKNTSQEELRAYVNLIADFSLGENDISRTDIATFSPQLSQEIIEKTIDKYNVSHQALLIVNNLLDFPILKKDIIYKDIFLPGKLLSNLKIDESIGISINEIDAFYRKRGRLIGQRGMLFKKILSSRGYH